MRSPDLFTSSPSLLKKVLTLSTLLFFTAIAASEPPQPSELAQAKSAFFSGDTERARDLFSLLTNSNKGEAYYYLALIQKRHADSSDSYVTMVDYLRKSSSAGNSLAMWELGEAYQNGYGVEKDAIRAMDWYRKSEANLGKETQPISFQTWEGGELREQPKSEMVEQIRDLANSGDVDAQYQLAKTYDRGLLTEQDTVKAFHWYHQAAVNGHDYAGYSLAYFYCRGIGTEQNVKKSNYWMTKSGRSGECTINEGAKK